MTKRINYKRVLKELVEDLMSGKEFIFPGEDPSTIPCDECIYPKDKVKMVDILGGFWCFVEINGCYKFARGDYNEEIDDVICLAKKESDSRYTGEIYVDTELFRAFIRAYQIEKAVQSVNEDTLV